jgi:hypothetical protein
MNCLKIFITSISVPLTVRISTLCKPCLIQGRYKFWKVTNPNSWINLQYWLLVSQSEQKQCSYGSSFQSWSAALDILLQRANRHEAFSGALKTLCFPTFFLHSTKPVVWHFSSRRHYWCSASFKKLLPTFLPWWILRKVLQMDILCLPKYIPHVH